MSAVRIALVGGVISYRALFNWIRPTMYIPTMLGSPLFQVLFFSYLGAYAGVQDTAFFVIGNSVQVCAMAGIYGMTMTIANERQLGTLSSLLATPANRTALFLGRALPVIANGLVVSAFAFLVGAVLLGYHPPASSLPALSVAVLVSVVSCTAFGMVLGAIGLRARDVFFIANVVVFLMLVFCGVNVPLDSLPSWMQQVSAVLPLTHGIEAAREIAAGSSLSAASDLIAKEVAIGVAYYVVAIGLLRLFEHEGRSRGALDTF